MRMNSKLTVLLIASAAWLEATAQSIAPQVLSNCGASASNAGYRMDWTFGEFAIASIGNSEYRITQGFHQPYAGTVGIEEVMPNMATTWIWPNPAGNELNLGFSGSVKKGSTVRILSVDGKTRIIFALTPGGNVVTLPLRALADGSYLLVIEDPDGALSTHRFIKTP